MFERIDQANILQLRQVLKQCIYDPGEPKTIFWSFVANSIAGSFIIPARARTIILRILGIKISLRALIRPRVVIRSDRLVIGAKSTVNYGCIFDNRAGVEIGKSVGIGINVQFINTDHDVSDPSRRAGSSISGKVVVEDGVFIGSGAILLPGVTVGHGAVVAAGSVVTRDCEPDGVYAGIPARRIRELPVIK